MLDFRPIFLVTGILLLTLAAAMLVPALVDLAAGNPDWMVFVAGSMFTLFVGGVLFLTNLTDSRKLGVRQAFLLTTIAWVAMPAFAALPFRFSELQLDYTDAFFEAMSGLTTTGSTVIVGLEAAPPGILLWRSLLQWLGGIGILVMAISVLPMLQIGGMQLFRMEFAERIEKALPRAAQIAASILMVYLALTGACVVVYWSLGMGPFDAINHAMTTVATGGFSTKDASLGHFDHTGMDVAATVFMILGSLPFLLYVQMTRGSWGALLNDSQVRWFFALLGISVVMLVLHLVMVEGWSVIEAARYAAFNATSVMTGTGYATDDFSLWGAFALPVFFFLMFLGGCAGSTTCGIKIFRVQVLYETARTQLKRLLQPHGVFIGYYNRRPIPPGVAESVMSFFFLYAACFGLLAIGLGAMGLDFLTATSGAATAISNVGPGLGPIIGPAGTFASLPDAAKWLLAFGMLLGRLELFTILVLLAPSFWRG